jgi:hypothetical protein
VQLFFSERVTFSDTRDAAADVDGSSSARLATIDHGELRRLREPTGANAMISFRFCANFMEKGLETWLPDDLFSNRTSQFGKILEGLGMEKVGLFYDHFEWPFGTFYVMW